MEAICAAAYLRQRSQLRDLLLGGRLAELAMLDRPAIEAYLARDLADGEFDYFRLIEIGDVERWVRAVRSEEHTSELQSLMRISYAVFCLKKKKKEVPTPIQTLKY